MGPVCHRWLRLVIPLRQTQFGSSGHNTRRSACPNVWHSGPRPIGHRSSIERPPSTNTVPQRCNANNYDTLTMNTDRRCAGQWDRGNIQRRIRKDATRAHLRQQRAAAAPKARRAARTRRRRAPGRPQMPRAGRPFLQQETSAHDVRQWHGPHPWRKERPTHIQRLQCR